MLTTIGYERSSLADFVATLVLHEVDVLCDIRDRAQSRVPGFSKTPLAEALANAGIEYVHFRELGDPKEGREAARAGDIDLFRTIYASVLESVPARSALKDIRDISKEKLVCLLCYERDERHCHRKMVSDKLSSEYGLSARHIGVRKGQASVSKAGRVLHSHQGIAASLEQIF